MPEWGGAQAGLPGKAFAKVLRDVQTGEAPVVSYWKQALIVSDNRIPALGSDRSVYTVCGAAGRRSGDGRGRAALPARLSGGDGRQGWNEPDIVMEQVEVTLP